MDLATQLFHALTAVNLKHAAELRPLTQSEKSLLEQVEAKAGPLLPEIEAAIKSLQEPPK